MTASNDTQYYYVIDKTLGAGRGLIEKILCIPNNRKNSVKSVEQYGKLKWMMKNRIFGVGTTVFLTKEDAVNRLGGNICAELKRLERRKMQLLALHFRVEGAEMTRRNTPQEMIEVIQAKEDGRIIQSCLWSDLDHSEGIFIDDPNPGFDFSFKFYRVKEEPVIHDDVAWLWLHSDGKYGFVIRQPNGQIWLTTHEPLKLESFWSVAQEGEALRITPEFKITIGNQPWDNSLQKRPEGI